MKIKKLLALGESSNENEAKIALLKAQELLAKHNISKIEVEDYKDSSVIKHKTGVKFTKGKWKMLLADLIGENFKCFTYCSAQRSREIVFLGREEDIIVCNIAFEYAIYCINSEVRKLRYIYYKKEFSTKGLESDYAIGFIQGLRSAFEKQKAKNQEWGLVLVKDKEVTETYKELDFGKPIRLNMKYNNFYDAYNKGYKEGEKFSISNRIAEEENI